MHLEGWNWSRDPPTLVQWRGPGTAGRAREGFGEGGTDRVAEGSGRREGREEWAIWGSGDRGTKGEGEGMVKRGRSRQGLSHRDSRSMILRKSIRKYMDSTSGER